MNRQLREELRKELSSRGFRGDGTSPNDTIVLGDAFLDDVELASLFDTLVSRREKLFRSGDVVGMDAAKKGYDDVVLAIDAVKALISRIAPPLP
jgi:hypothetical protein